MHTTLSLLDLLCESKNWTDYRAAKELEVTQQAVSSWRCRGTVMKDETGSKVAALLGFKEKHVHLWLHLERSKDCAILDELEQWVAAQTDAKTTGKAPKKKVETKAA